MDEVIAADDAAEPKQKRRGGATTDRKERSDRPRLRQERAEAGEFLELTREEAAERWREEVARREAEAADAASSGTRRVFDTGGDPADVREAAEAGEELKSDTGSLVRRASGRLSASLSGIKSFLKSAIMEEDWSLPDDVRAEREAQINKKYARYLEEKAKQPKLIVETPPTAPEQLPATPASEKKWAVTLEDRIAVREEELKRATTPEEQRRLKFELSIFKERLAERKVEDATRRIPELRAKIAELERAGKDAHGNAADEIEKEILSSERELRRNEGIVAGDEHLQLEAEIEARFNDQNLPELAALERKKTPEEEQVIRVANELANEAIVRYGGMGRMMPMENVHIIDSIQWQDFSKKFGTSEKLGAMWVGQEQAVVLKGDPDRLQITAAHELLHVGTTNQFAFYPEGKSGFTKKQVGISVYESEKDVWRFNGLNEAITEEMNKRMFMNLEARKDFKTRKDLQELSKAITEGQKLVRESGNFGYDDVLSAKKMPDGTIQSVNFSYSAERKMLSFLTKGIYEKRKNEFASPDAVFDLFAEASVHGNTREIQGLVESAFGKGAWEEVGDDSKNALERLELLEERAGLRPPRRPAEEAPKQTEAEMPTGPTKAEQVPAVPLAEARAEFEDAASEYDATNKLRIFRRDLIKTEARDALAAYNTAIDREVEALRAEGKPGEAKRLRNDEGAVLSRYRHKRFTADYAPSRRTASIKAKPAAKASPEERKP